MIVRSKAPLRISFGGGGTDVPPYPEERGGAVLSCTIDKYAYASLRPRKDGALEVRSLDYDVVAKYHADDPLTYDGRLDLVKASMRVMGTPRGADLFLHTDAPPGSGLGSSSAMTVSLVGAVKHWKHLALTNYEIAELAYRIEREELLIKGGLQDQYAAVFGGFNFIEFFAGHTVVNALRISPDVLNELHYCLLLCYTGHTRLSSGILDEQIANYVTKLANTVNSLDEQKLIVIDMKKALLLGKLLQFAELMNDAWQSKKRFASQITTPAIDELYETARRAGALGGKLLGAGGGGYMLLYCPFEAKPLVSRAVERIGAQVVDFDFEFAGLQSWGV